MTDVQGKPDPTTITVSENDTLPQVMDRLRAVRGNRATLVIPDHVPTFLTASDFRTLRDIADRVGVTVALETDDSLRIQLASMFGLADYTRPTSPDDDGETDREVEANTAFHGWRSARTRHAQRLSGAPPEEDQDDDPIATSRRRRADLYGPTTSPAPATEPIGNVGLSSDASHVALSYLDEDPAAERAKLIGRIVAVVLVVALVLGIACWWAMPQVTVTATLREGQISTELLYSVTRPGASAPSDAAFAVEGTEVSDTIEFTIEVPVTGKEVTPDQTATGVVTLRNASTEAVTIPAGTTLTTAAGVAVTTDAEAHVPAGSPDGSTIGETTVNVTAVEPGSGGNLAAGALSGKIADQPVYFSNRDQAMQGGSDIEVGVVTAEDLATAENEVKSNLRRPVAEAWNATLPEGQSILTPSVVAENPDYTIIQKEGDKAESVTVEGTVEASALSYDVASVQEQARQHYQEDLQAKVPEGYELLPTTLVLGSPNLVSESPDSVEFMMEGAATVRAVFDETTQQNLAKDLAGRSPEEVEGILANVPALSSWEISRNPGWWPDRMPRAESRVTVEVKDVPASIATPTSSPEPAT